MVLEVDLTGAAIAPRAASLLTLSLALLAANIIVSICLVVDALLNSVQLVFLRIQL